MGWDIKVIIYFDKRILLVSQYIKKVFRLMKKFSSQEQFKIMILQEFNTHEIGVTGYKTGFEGDASLWKDAI